MTNNDISLSKYINKVAEWAEKEEAKGREVFFGYSGHTSQIDITLYKNTYKDRLRVDGYVYLGKSNLMYSTFEYDAATKKLTYIRTNRNFNLKNFDEFLQVFSDWGDADEH